MWLACTFHSLACLIPWMICPDFGRPSLNNFFFSFTDYRPTGEHPHLSLIYDADLPFPTVPYPFLSHYNGVSHPFLHVTGHTFERAYRIRRPRMGSFFPSRIVGPMVSTPLIIEFCWPRFDGVANHPTYLLGSQVSRDPSLPFQLPSFTIRCVWPLFLCHQQHFNTPSKWSFVLPPVSQLGYRPQFPAISSPFSPLPLHFLF